jgi:hypothetical protein
LASRSAGAVAAGVAAESTPAARGAFAAEQASSPVE